jgi:hypothetical protein
MARTKAPAASASASASAKKVSQQAARAASSPGARTLSARDLRINRTLTPIAIPDLGGVVYKRELPASVMISRPVVADPGNPADQQSIVSYFICKSIVDENGAQIFDDSEADSLRDTLSIGVYTTLAQAVTGSQVASLSNSGLAGSGSGSGTLPNASPAVLSSDSPIA